MRYLSIFSGIEAVSCAWCSLDMAPVAFSEIDPFCSAVLAYHYPDVPNLGDITQARFAKYKGKVDLVVGGSPCQSFSVAGDRSGLNGASGLMLEYVRCIREVRPYWFIWENVPGALTSTRGQDFRCFIDAMAKLGYCLSWRILDAQYFGLPQRRKRVFVVGSLGDTRSAEVLFERKSLQGDFSSRKKIRETVPARLGASSRKSICLADDTAHAACDYELAGTLKVGGMPPAVVTPKISIVRCGTNGSGGRGALVSDNCSLTLSTSNLQQLFVPQNETYVVRRLTPLEFERLQGFPDNWTDVELDGKPPSDSARYKALGNSMAVPVMKWIGERILQAK